MIIIHSGGCWRMLEDDGRGVIGLAERLGREKRASRKEMTKNYSGEGGFPVAGLKGEPEGPLPSHARPTARHD